MGYLHYAGTERFSFDDRLLTHLRTVIFRKFTLQESLSFTWRDDGVQRSIWLHPAIPLHFEFDAEHTPDINGEWIELLFAHANSATGLRDIEEPSAP